MPFRSLPRTDLGHLDALEVASRKLDARKPGEPNPLTPKTRTRLSQILPRFRSEVRGRQQITGQQTEATSAARRTKATLRLHVTH